jgi:hypothetical protein
MRLHKAQGGSGRRPRPLLLKVSNCKFQAAQAQALKREREARFPSLMHRPGPGLFAKAGGPNAERRGNAEQRRSLGVGGGGRGEEEGAWAQGPAPDAPPKKAVGMPMTCP